MSKVEKNNDWKKWIAIAGIVIAICGGMVGYGKIQAQSQQNRELINENKQKIEEICQSLIRIEKQLGRIGESIKWIVEIEKTKVRNKFSRKGKQ